MIIQKGFDFLLDVLSEHMASPYSDNPVIGISQVFDPDETRVIDLESLRLTHF
jgi:hypothetical protein